MKFKKLLQQMDLDPNDFDVEEANELAIELIAALYAQGPDAFDDAGFAVTDHLQTDLVKVFLQSRPIKNWVADKLSGLEVAKRKAAHVEATFGPEGTHTMIGGQPMAKGGMIPTLPKLGGMIPTLAQGFRPNDPMPLPPLPPLSFTTLSLDAFNLWVGAAFVRTKVGYEPEVWVVTRFEDFTDTEEVLVTARLASDAEVTLDKPFVFGYCDKVRVVGNVRNAHDNDDNNWGDN